MPHNPLRTAFVLILYTVLSASAQSNPHPAFPTHVDTLKDGTTVEYIKEESLGFAKPDSAQRPPVCLIASDSLAPPSAPKSELLAYGLGAGGMLLPILGGYYYDTHYHDLSDRMVILIPVSIGALIIVGPSPGQFYAGSISQGLIGCTQRAAVGAAGVGGILLTISGIGIYDDNPGPGVIFVAGSALILWSTIHSLIDIHHAVQRANCKIKPRRFGFSPELFPSSNGGLKPGVLAWAQF